MNEILIASEDDLDSLLFGEGDDLPVLVLFTAPTWCVPCRQFEPHWNKAQETLTNYVFAKVDMGATPEDTGYHWATAAYGIRGVPSVKLFPEGDEPHINIKVPQGVVTFVKEVQSYGAK